MTKRRGGRPLKRKVGQRPELRTLVVFCEGKISEPNYINALIRIPEVADRFFVRIATEHGVPLTLVEKAIARAKGEEVDECWMPGMKTTAPHSQTTIHHRA
ncbi:MAG: RloB family protein [Propionibacteriaceae bacterium]|nr:RloB family protein [Propionibacteriaceae bacterium]